MRSTLITFGLFILQLVAMSVWFYVMQPASKESLDIFLLIPVLIGINLILSLVLYFMRKPWSILLLMNSIICPLMFYAIWIMWFTYWSV